jgi:uncharacterized protein
MRKRRWLMWQGLIVPSLERFIVTPLDHGFELSGLILQAHEEAPYVARYTIRVDEVWMTQTVEVELENGGQRARRLSRAADGHWTKDGQALPGFENCVDVDLEWSPSTNTLPIRRLNLATGTKAAMTAAWIRFPTLEVQRLDQSYERLAGHRYRYQSGQFSADLEVDGEGWVLRYGNNWALVASG